MVVFIHKLQKKNDKPKQIIRICRYIFGVDNLVFEYKCNKSDNTKTSTICNLKAQNKQYYQKNITKQKIVQNKKYYKTKNSTKQNITTFLN